MYYVGMKWYVNQLEETIIQLCSKFHLDANRSPHTGVWIGDDKICAMGVSNSRFVTSHGLAINCNVDLNWFGHIVPCGIEGKGVTSLSQQLKRNVTIEETQHVFIEMFKSNFECQLDEMSESQVKYMKEEFVIK